MVEEARLQAGLFLLHYHNSNQKVLLIQSSMNTWAKKYILLVVGIMAGSPTPAGHACL
jgi:hypothetical protein